MDAGGLAVVTRGRLRSLPKVICIDKKGHYSMALTKKEDLPKNFDHVYAWYRL